MTQEIELKPKAFGRTNRSDWPGEAPRFDCIEALKPHIGYACWDDFLRYNSANQCACCTREDLKVAFGVEGFPTEAYYDLIFGQGAYERDLPEHTNGHIAQAYAHGLAIGATILAGAKSGQAEGSYVYTGLQDFKEDFIAGIEDATRVQLDRRDLK